MGVALTCVVWMTAPKVRVVVADAGEGVTQWWTWRERMEAERAKDRKTLTEKIATLTAQVVALLKKQQRQAQLVNDVKQQLTDTQSKLHDLQTELAYTQNQLNDTRQEQGEHAAATLTELQKFPKFFEAFQYLSARDGLRLVPVDVNGVLMFVVNPPEDRRGYSSVYNNDKKGTGHARSTLDSPQAWTPYHYQTDQNPQCVPLLFPPWPRCSRHSLS